MDVAVTSGNVSDCIPYLERIEYIEDTLDIDVEAVAVDSGYDTSLIHKELEERGITIFTPEKATSDTSKTEFGRKDFSYHGSAEYKESLKNDKSGAKVLSGHRNEIII